MKLTLGMDSCFLFIILRALVLDESTLLMMLQSIVSNAKKAVVGKEICTYDIPQLQTDRYLVSV